ncbi:hypothetical protein [Acidovorax sp. RAC01]|uniref:hypothetical protein n=1 Tax=Acidovorax sp. RAC01 TaxID=1842533 RepID=UPI00085884C3|nr:hypothetical protein [Acidovorax sp. RAC01]AOG24370.1 hypothetical protein BSY15_80 [Acidovorax sp. RAC01]
MRLNIVAGLLTTLFVAGCAVAQSPKPEDEHAGHHPGDAQSGGVTTQSAPAATAASAPDAFDRQMKAMQEMHKKMQAAKTPAERSALMEEHMKLMQSGMAMMGAASSGGMGMGMMQQGAQAKPAAPAASGNPGMGGMMGMHAQMERRMAMMEQMMQMMVDRQAAMPSK